MNKLKIKEILRESLTQTVREVERPSKDSSNNDNHTEDNYEKDYGELERKLDGTMLKASQVMKAAGLGSPDDATARSLFSKKVRREKNDEGGLYQFSEEDLASIMKVINNPTSYLNTKN